MEAEGEVEVGWQGQHRSVEEVPIAKSHQKSMAYIIQLSLSMYGISLSLKLRERERESEREYYVAREREYIGVW